MAGQVLVGQWKRFREADGSLAALIEPSAINHLILKLAYGSADKTEREFARNWRAATSNLSLDDFKATLDRYFVVVARVSTAGELKTVCDRVLRDPSLQGAWLECILRVLAPDEETSAAIVSRLELAHRPRLEAFAPYAVHCLRVLLMMYVACRDGLLNWQPTHLLDAQYLYYLPFCTVFSSDDHVHQLLAPLLVRDDQSFIQGTVLKAGLQAIADFFDERTDQERTWLSYALGGHPPPLPGNALSDLWRLH